MNVNDCCCFCCVRFCGSIWNIAPSGLDVLCQTDVASCVRCMGSYSSSVPHSLSPSLALFVPAAGLLWATYEAERTRSRTNGRQSREKESVRHIVAKHFVYRCLICLCVTVLNSIVGCRVCCSVRGAEMFMLGVLCIYVNVIFGRQILDLAEAEWNKKTAQFLEVFHWLWAFSICECSFLFVVKYFVLFCFHQSYKAFAYLPGTDHSIPPVCLFI